jgi:type II secretory ATPase GspE/PulE/Tfp pilus assembly ATPase PilB-like protein
MSVDDPDARLGLPVATMKVPAGCPECRGSGYRGRMVVAEMLPVQNNELARSILSRTDRARLQQLAVESGMAPLVQRACETVEAGLTSPREVRRVLGFGDE